MKTYHYIVKGRVQGVAFRYYTVKTARKLGVSGNVKNLYNGDVEVYAQGEKEIIDQLETFLHQGPIAASVVQVVKEEFHSRQLFTGFDILY